MSSVRVFVVRAVLGLLAVMFVGCFRGDFLAGQPCRTDDDCGASFTCEDGTCSGTSCGNGVLEARELCDAAGESADCDVDCTPVRCGDGRVNVSAGEQCDGSDLGGVDCTMLGWFEGTPLCVEDCTFATSTCSGCMLDSACPDETPICDVVTHECTGCSSDDACREPAPVCDPDTDTCVGCLEDADCGGWPTPLCDMRTKACVGCLEDADCGGWPTPLCDMRTNACVGCVEDADCSETAPLCDPTNQACVGCFEDADCSEPTPTCDLGIQTCVGCVEDADCSEPTPACDPTNQACVGCLGDADCSEPTPACDPERQACVGCLGDADCSAPTPVCDPENQTCVGCVNDGDCNSPTPACDPELQECVGCLSNADCSAPAPACHVSVQTCVECVDDSYCLDPLASTCNPAVNLCVGCLSDADCGASTPICDVGSEMCVECFSDQDCLFGDQCDVASNACVAYCEQDGDCPGVEVCDLAVHACVEVPCVIDEDCPSGSSPCMGGVCAPAPCLQDVNCPDDSSECDTTLGLCTPGPGSQCDIGGAQCGMGNYSCADGYCANCQIPGNRCLRCADNPVVCNASHLCNMEIDACVECVVHADCPAGEICHPAGECALGCSGLGTCPGFARCDQYSRCGQNLYGDECRDDADCPGMQCVQGYCRDCILDGANECQTCILGDAAGQCGGGLCDYDVFVCVSCRDNGDCGGATPVCNFGACQPPCSSDLDCAAFPGATCNTGSNACELPPAPPCVSNNDCVGFGSGSEVICNAGACDYP